MFAVDRLERLDGRTVGDPSATLARWTAEFGAVPALFVGRRRDAVRSGDCTARPRARVITRHPHARRRRSDASRSHAPPKPSAPAGMQPLYVRRPDAEIAREARVTPIDDRARHRPSRPMQIDDILAIEEASFTNPWTREMYLAELENRGVSFCLPREATTAAMRSASARSGGCSTNCTSTTWPWCRNVGGRVSRSALLTHVLAGGRRGSARSAPRWRCGARTTTARAAVRAVRVHRCRASGRRTTPSRSRTRWSSGGNDLRRADLERLETYAVSVRRHCNTSSVHKEAEHECSSRRS